MVHKKYIKRGNKIFGPYLYENYRVNGITKTRYLGLAKEEKVQDNPSDLKKGSGDRYKGMQVNRKILLPVISAAFLILILAAILFFSGLTGRASLEIGSSYISGENITGNLNLMLREGELIPADSLIKINMAGEEKSFLLSELVEINNNGSFYAENKEISGEGRGYGFPGSRAIYPDINFVLKVFEQGEGAEAETTENQTQAVSEEKITGQPAEEPAETPISPAEETPAAEETQATQTEHQETETKAEAKQEKKEEKAETTEETSQETPAEETQQAQETEAGITGASVKESKKEINGKASKGNDFIYNLEQGETAEIKKNSVKIEEKDEKGKIKEKKADDNILNLKISGQETRVSTDYSETTEGFGKDYLGDEKKLEINLDNLGIKARQGELKISLFYKDIVLAEESKEIYVSGENLAIENKTEIIEQNITEINITETNITIINETLENITLAGNITLKQYKAVIGKPVKWLKKIQIENEADLQVEIPKEAENINVKTGSEIADAENALENSGNIVENADKTSLITGNLVFETSENGIFSRLFRFFKLRLTGNVVSESELDITETLTQKIVDVSSVASPGEEVAVEYETPAPISDESEIPGGKRITVSSADELNYTDILAYSLIPEKIRSENNKSIKLYHYVWHELSGEAEDMTENEAIISVTENQNKSSAYAGLINETLENETINEAEENNQAREETTLINETSEQQLTDEQNNSGSGLITGQAVADVNERLNEADNISAAEKIRGYWAKEEIDFDAYDIDENGLIDYIEWNVPHLSEQVYEIIYITKAEHLDENYSFVEDVYEQVKSLDENYTEIPSGDYLRVTFEKSLDKTKDITIYARSKCNNSIEINGENVSCEIYEKKMRIDEIRRQLGE